MIQLTLGGVVKKRLATFLAFAAWILGLTYMFYVWTILLLGRPGTPTHAVLSSIILNAVVFAYALKELQKRF